MVGVSECRVSVVGEEGVGKAALVNSFLGGDFNKSCDEPESPLTKYKTALVSGRKVHFTISSSSSLEALSPCSPLLSSDVFLLCFSICDHSSLYTALDHWLPAIKDLSPLTPVILVGCKGDLRTSGRLQRLVSAEHALSLSKQAGAAMYLETSAIVKDSRSTTAAFEVASLASQGHFPTRNNSGQGGKEGSLHVGRDSLSQERGGDFSSKCGGRKSSLQEGGSQVSVLGGGRESSRQGGREEYGREGRDNFLQRGVEGFLQNRGDSSHQGEKESCVQTGRESLLPPWGGAPCRGRAVGRREVSEPRLQGGRTGGRLNCLQAQGDNYQVVSELSSSRSGSISSVSLHSKSSTLSSSPRLNREVESKSSTLSSTASDSSTGSRNIGQATMASPSSVSANLSCPVLRVTTGRTPSVARKLAHRNKGVQKEEMVTIQCQRLNAAGLYEEIDIEVPAGVYNNIQTPGDLSHCSRNSRDRRSFGSRLKSLLLKS